MRRSITRFGFAREGFGLEDYFFETPLEENRECKVYVLIIYDIVDDRKRLKLSKFLQGYGFRIQKSAFEAMLSPRLYRELKSKIAAYASEEDSIRVYKIIGKGQVSYYGKKEEIGTDDVIII